MSKPNNTNKKYPRVTLDCRISCTHPYFRGDGYTAQVFFQLATMQAFEECEKRLHERSNMVNLKRTQVLTSVRTLVALTGFTKHRVEKALKRLVKLKLIQREKCEEMQGLSRNDGEVITVLRLAGYPKLPDTSSATKSDVINNSSSKTKADGFVLPTELDTPSMQEAWGDFITHRKQKQKGLTERSAKLVLNKLVAAKLTPDEAATELNKAIECGWTSVFPKKEDTSIKAVNRTRKSSYTPAGPEALIASDTAALGMRAA